MSLNAAANTVLNIYLDDHLAHSLALSAIATTPGALSDELPPDAPALDVTLQRVGDHVYLTSENPDQQVRVGEEWQDLPWTLQFGDSVDLAPNIRVALEDAAQPDDPPQETVAADEADDALLTEVVMATEQPASNDADPFAWMADDIQAQKDARAITVAAPTDLMEEKTLARIGCGFCFHTLDPNDPDPSRRSFCKHNGLFYHETCLQRLDPAIAAAAEQITVDEPDPLPDTPRRGLALHGGPINRLTDHPLGLSRGSIFFDADSSKPYESFVIRNNSDRRLSLPRDNSPLWAYVDYGNYEQVSSELRLEAQQMQQADIYPHPARPAWQSVSLDFLEAHSLHVVSSALKTPFIQSMVVFAAILVNNLWAATNAFWEPELRLIFIVSTAAVLGWLAWMMPATLLWRVFHALQFVSEIEIIRKATPVHDLLGAAQQRIWTIFADRQMVRLYEDPSLLWLVAAIGFVVGLLPAIVLWGLLSLLLTLIPFFSSGLGLLLLRIAYIGAVYAFAVLVVGLYDVPLHRVTRRTTGQLVNRSRAALRSHFARGTVPRSSD